MFKLKCLILVLMVSFVCMPNIILAQWRPHGKEGKFEEKQQVRERIEQMRMWKLLEVLDLSDEQAEGFLPILNAFQKQQKELEHKKRESLKVLEDELNKKSVDLKKVQTFLEDLEKNRVLFEKNRVSFLSKAKEVLSLEQQAKLVLFEERFAERMKQMIRKVVRGKREG